ncbi:MAG TPA: class I SAM-dependent methyltransferase [Chloroflexaceae bacterium]|nr:class I SAM-dependent methyltransferase [Chloroflexaceae bacterium]
MTLADLPRQWRRSLLMQVDCLGAVLPPQSHILEIGCGEGVLLALLGTKGFKVTGIEPSVSASKEARRRGLEVHTGSFPEIHIDTRVDAVILSHVLEHMPRPASVLGAINNLLDHGYVLLVQTNWRGLLPRVLGRRWYAWVPEQHFWHFTPRGLETLYQPLGWATHAISYSSLVHRGGLHPLSELAWPIPGLGDQFQILAKTHAYPKR